MLDSILQTVSFSSILDLFGHFQLGSWQIPIFGLILTAVSVVILLIIYSYLMRRINRKITLQGSTPDVYNGLKFVIRLLLGIIFIILFMNFLNVQSSYVLIVSGIIISAIAFGSMNAINNFIAGMWILLVRPFTIGDYININGSEGVVSEISLNYTRIIHVDESVSLIPNINCLNKNIINYTISKTWMDQYLMRLKLSKEKIETTIKENHEDFRVLHKINEELTQVEKTLKMMKNIEENFSLKEISHSKYVRKNKMVRYVLQLNLDKRVLRNEPLFRDICQKWEEKFLIRPYWQIYGTDFYIYYRFILLTPDPEYILRYLGDFVKDIYEAIYTL